MAIAVMLPENTGGAETLTTIWENASPSSSFLNGGKTLTESMSGYKRIRIVFRPFSATDESVLGILEVPVDTITNFQNNANQPYFGLNGWGSSYQYMRGVYVPDDAQTSLDKLYFLHCYRVGSSTSTTYDQYCVPLYVYGIR